jgi:DNA-binding LytR/AlgR family response regulator
MTTASPVGLRSLASLQSFRRTLIGWTLAYWVLVYAFLTIRSVVGGLGYLTLQAALRVPMMAVGLGLCALLYVMLVRIDHLPLRIRIALASLAVIGAAFAFSLSAYFVFYVWPHTWQPEQSLATYLSRFTLQVPWVFAAWVLLFHYLRHRAVAASTGARAYETELWARHVGQQVRIPVADIDWIEAEGDYARVHVGDRSYLIRSTMQRMEESLDPALLVRVHRRAIVARDAIVAASRGADGRLTVRLKTGASVLVGRKHAGRLKADVAARSAASADKS